MYAQVGRADECKPFTGKHSLRDESNGNEVTLINCASVSNMVIGNTILGHNNKLICLRNHQIYIILIKVTIC